MLTAMKTFASCFIKNMPTEKYRTSTQEDEYEYLHEKDDEIKGDNIKDENEGIIEYGNDLTNCNIIHDRDST